MKVSLTLSSCNNRTALRCGFLERPFGERLGLTACSLVTGQDAQMREVSGRGDHRVVPYDPEWVSRASALMRTVRDALGSTALRVEHIGSTAVPGLAARPIPDIQVSIADVSDPEAFCPRLEAAGYKHFSFPELDVDDYYVFVPADGSNTEHIQVCQIDSHQERRHLAVRDYLRANPAERSAYEREKRASAERASGDRSTYSQGKDAFVKALERRALEWLHADDRR